MPTLDKGAAHVDTPTAADYMGGLNPDTLRVWRRKGRGPAYIKVGRRVVYRRSDLDAWLDTHRVDPQAAAS